MTCPFESFICGDSPYAVFGVKVVIAASELWRKKDKERA
jgi:hypothetical protein